MPSVYELLKQAVTRLSLPGEEMADYIGHGMEFPVSYDDLALDFDDCFICLSGLKKRGLVSEQLAEILITIDHKLKAISGAKNKNLWTEEAVRTNPHWDEIRQLAKKALEKI